MRTWVFLQERKWQDELAAQTAALQAKAQELETLRKAVEAETEAKHVRVAGEACRGATKNEATCSAVGGLD